MTQWHTTMTVFVIAQLFLLSILFMQHRPYRNDQTIVAALLLSVIAYLLIGSSFALYLDGPGRALLGLLAYFPPYLLWLFVIRVFEIDFVGVSRATLVLLIPLSIWLLPLIVPAVAGTVWFDAHRVFSILFLVHSVVATLSGRSGDLLERRRRYRLWFVLLIALQALAVLTVELIYPEGGIPMGLRLLSVATIGVLTVGLALPLLRLEWDWLDKSPDLDVEEAREPNALERRLRDVMDGGYFTTTGLSIGMLAAHLAVPEYRLRQQINTDMGFRNFNAYLNSYRLNAAAEALSDRAQDSKPILSIALELGFASIGPFNRAFKQTYGMTPGQFRRQSD